MKVHLNLVGKRVNQLHCKKIKTKIKGAHVELRIKIKVESSVLLLEIEKYIK